MVKIRDIYKILADSSEEEITISKNELERALAEIEKYTEGLSYKGGDKARTLEYMERARAKNTLGLLGAALKDMEHALALKHDLAWLIYLERGLMYSHSGKCKEALQDFDAAEKLAPKKDAFFYHDLARGKRNLNLLNEALEYLRKALTLNPDFAEAYQDRGEIKLEQCEFEEAVKDFGEALKRKPDLANAYYFRGVAKLQLHQYPEAMENIETALKLNPAWGRAYFFKGYTHFMQSKYAEAILDFDNAILFGSVLVWNYFHRAVAKTNVGRFDEALEDFEKTLILDPNFEKAPVICFHKGYIKSKQGKLEDALKEYDTAIQTMPDCETVYYNRGQIYLKKDDLEKAILDFNKAIELNPANINAKKSLENALKQMESKKQAKTIQKSEKDIASAKIFVDPNEYAQLKSVKAKFDTLLQFINTEKADYKDIGGTTFEKVAGSLHKSD